MIPKPFMRCFAAASIVAAGALASSAALAVKVGPVEDPIRVVKIPKDQPIAIGVYEVLSGSDVALGLDQYRAIQVAVDDLGGKLLGHPIKLVVEDEGCSAEGGQTAATKIAANQQVVIALGGSCSSATRVAAPVLWKAGVPAIATSAGAPMLTDPKRGPAYDGLLRTIFNAGWSGRDTAKWAIEVGKYNKAATIHDGSTFAENLVRTFQATFREMGGEVCADEAIAPTDVDMRPLLTKIGTCKPQIIYFPLFVAAAGHVTRQAREIEGLQDVVLLGSDNLVTKDFLEAAGKAAVGLKFATTALEPEAQEADYPQLVEKYKAKFGEAPIQGFHAQAYDAMMLATKAIEKVAVKDDAGSTYVPIKALRDTLFATKNYKGLSGTLTCTEHGDCGAYKLAVYEFVSGDPATFKVGQNPKRIYPEKY